MAQEKETIEVTEDALRACSQVYAAWWDERGSAECENGIMPDWAYLCETLWTALKKSEMSSLDMPKHS